MANKINLSISLHVVWFILMLVNVFSKYLLLIALQKPEAGGSSGGQMEPGSSSFSGATAAPDAAEVSQLAYIEYSACS